MLLTFVFAVDLVPDTEEPNKASTLEATQLLPRKSVISSAQSTQLWEQIGKANFTERHLKQWAERATLVFQLCCNSMEHSSTTQLL
jgi:hypothetical protein